MENSCAQKVRYHDLMASLPPLPTPNQTPRNNRQAANSSWPPTLAPDPRKVCVEGERNNHIARLAGKWLHVGNTVEDVITLALAANDNFHPPLDDTEVITTCKSIARTHGRNNPIEPSLDDADPQPLFVVKDFKASRYLNTDPPLRRWLFKDIIPCGKVLLLVAPGGTGKTMFAIQLGASVATGLPFADVWEVGETGGALLLLGEDDDEELHRRTANIVTQLDPRRDTDAIAKLGENLIIRSMVGEDNLLTVADPQSREVRQTALVDRLIITAQQIPNLKLIVIDPASRFRGGDENASQDVTRFVEAVERVAQATGAAVLIIHHANKGSMSSSEPNQSASRGSSALTDGVRLQMNLATLDTNGAKKFGILEEQRKSHLSLSITKTNYSAPQQDIILRRSEGGYLINARLTPGKTPRTDTLDASIIQLVQSEAVAGRRHSKTAFANKFGGVDKELTVGNNKVRDAITGLLSSTRLVTENGKLALAKLSAPKVTRDIRRKKADGQIS
ncbi:MAG: AAA family ATPase [Candidatus Accumulibacter sp. UW26]|jgi:RecA-family ATPase